MKMTIQNIQKVQKIIRLVIGLIQTGIMLVEILASLKAMVGLLRKNKLKNDAKK